MTPQEALALINQTVRQVNTTANNHDLLKEAVQTLAGLIQGTAAAQDGAKPAEELPVELPANSND